MSDSEHESRISPNFTFWALVRDDRGNYHARPHVIIYPLSGMVEIVQFHGVTQRQ